jgi:hypothetical protein
MVGAVHEAVKEMFLTAVVRTTDRCSHSSLPRTKTEDPVEGDGGRRLNMGRQRRQAAMTITIMIMNHDDVALR